MKIFRLSRPSFQKNIILYIAAKCGVGMGHFPKRWPLRNNPEKSSSIRGGHFSTHGGAIHLKIVVIIQREIIRGENHANELAQCAAGMVV